MKDIKAKPEYPSSYVKIADCLRKMNMLDDAISFLEDAKKTDYYINPKPYSCFNTTVDRKLEDLYKKKERGYVFKPKKDTFEYFDYSMTIDDICDSYMQRFKDRPPAQTDEQP